MTIDPSSLIAAIRRALPAGTADVGLHEPEFFGNESKYLQDCIETGWVSYLGKYVDRFEAELAKRTGRRHAFAAVNGTAALHAALVVLGVAPGDEVILPSVTFVASANSVAQAGAIPHLVDIEARTLGLDIERLRAHLRSIAIRKNGQTINKQTGKRIAAIVPVHVFGQPVDHVSLDDVAGEFSLPVLVDATESLGSTWQGKPAGSFGLMSVLSFNGNKIVTTGGGGAIVTDDDQLAKTVRHVATTAKVPHQWAFIHDRTAFNYRLPNLNAAVGCAQLEKLDQFLAEKRQLAANYRHSLSNLAGIEVMTDPPGTESNYWLVAIKLDRALAAERDALLAALHAAGLKCRPLWTPMHMLPMFAASPRMDDLSVTEDMFARVINLPSSARLGRASGAPA
jgi:perosamine synthetase